LPFCSPRAAALAAAAAVALVAGASGPAWAGGPVQQAQLYSAYDFADGYDLQPSAWRQFTELGTVVAAEQLASDGMTGASSDLFDVGSREVWAVTDGATLTLPTGSVPPSDVGVGAVSWTLSEYVKPEVVANATTRLIDFGQGVLAAIDGALVWLPADESSSTVGPADEISGAYQEVTVQLEGATARVYLDDVLQLTIPDANATRSPVLFGDGAARIARLRTFAGLANPAELGPLDTAAPEVMNLFYNSYDDGDTMWVGPNSVGGWATDDGTSPVDVRLKVAQGSTTVKGYAPLSATAGYPSGPEQITTDFFAGPDFTDQLTDGVVYDFTVKATDAVGNWGESTSVAGWDKTAPTGLTASFATETTDRSPAFTGTGGAAPRDESFVYLTVCTSSPCNYMDDGNVVGFGQGTVGAGGAWTVSELRRYDLGRGFSMVPVGDLALGSYHVEVEQYDAVGNRSTVERPLKIVAPAPAPAAAPAAPAVVPPSVGVPAPPAPSPKQLSQRLLTSAIAAFGRETVRTFVKDGAKVPFSAPTPGTAIVQVYEGSAPKAIAAAKKTKKKKAKAPIASGKRVFTKAGSGTIKVTLTAKAKKALKRKKSVKVVIRTVFVPKNGVPVASDRKLTLKR
jgi:hypothetical protein